jgi:prepilin-type N-terminal cleavage/methylation domain-containing protein/prepilin-type processing-associated H-X9-DG protein
MSLALIRKAFTLIELLVVIAIIALLAAILFPVFARARENARRSSCQSNLKQIALGIKQYSQDYDEYFPMGWQAGQANGWASVIQPYVKSDSLFQCPSQQNADTSPAAGDTTNKMGYSDYFYNINLGTGDNSYCAGKKNVKEAEVDSSSVVVMLGDGGRGGINNIANSPPLASYTAGTDYTSLAATDVSRRPNSIYVPGWYTKSRAGFGTWAFTNGSDLQAVNNTHLEGMNIGFVDGHVKWYKPEKLAFNNPSSDPTFKVNDINGGVSAAKPGCTP